MGIEKAEKRVSDYPHQYSGGMKEQALLAAQPSRGLHVQSGYATIMAENIESGCPFRLRCGTAFQKCREKPPLFKQDGHEIRCWRYAS